MKKSIIFDISITIKETIMKKYIATWNNEQKEIWAENLEIAKNRAKWIKISHCIKGKTIVKLKK